MWLVQYFALRTVQRNSQQWLVSLGDSVADYVIIDYVSLLFQTYICIKIRAHCFYYIEVSLLCIVFGGFEKTRQLRINT